MNHIKLLLIPAGFLSFIEIFAQNKVVTTYSTINALLSGLYDGTFTVKELKQRGNFGIGTFHALDGEMVMIKGKVYQAKADGSSHEVKNTTRIPWATVTNFKKRHRLSLPDDLTYNSFREQMDALLPIANFAYAIWVEGTFSIKARSIPAQTKPYLPMMQIVKKQSIFNFKRIRGTLIGFRCPNYVNAINVPGYHLHFLSADLKHGGHVLDFTLERGMVWTDKYNQLSLILPHDKAFFDVDLTTEKSPDLKKVELDEAAQK